MRSEDDGAATSRLVAGQGSQESGHSFICGGVIVLAFEGQTISNKPLRFLFVKNHLAWPRSSGHDVHSFNLMRSLGEQGHALALLTASEPTDQALAGLRLETRWTFDQAPAPAPEIPLSLTRWQEKFRSYWGIEPETIRTVAYFSREFQADAVVVAGLEVLPYLAGVTGAQRIWYAADEWVWHHWSLVQWSRPSTWSQLRQAAIKGLYERAYGPMLDRVWVVTDADARAMRWVTKYPQIDVIPNGVDSAYFHPVAVTPEPNTCTFWGRLDFEPNIQGLEWFCERVWPLVQQQRPEARFTIYGFQPTPAALALTKNHNVQIIPNLPDLREETARHAVVVLPFVSGGGIKNKLLEAASLGRAIVCSPRAVQGLHYDGDAPFAICRRPWDWVVNILRLWDDDDQRRRLGSAARQWVLKHHTWDQAARRAVAGLLQAKQGLTR